MAKNFTLLLAALILTGCNALFPPRAFAAILLAEGGKTPYVISLATDAIPAEKTAADQLQKYLQQVTGAPFPIEPETAVKAGAPQILVGAGARVKALLPHQDWNSLGTDGIVIKTVGNNLILAGGRPRGTLYAVFQFLEDSVGCRWWTPTENMIPHQGTLDVPQQNVVYVSPFNYREHYTNEVQDDPVFATIMRENGNFQKQDATWGGHYEILGRWCHTFGQLLPLKTYFKEHPDWYSDPQNSNKPCTAASKMPDSTTTQLCLSNPQVLDELTRRALEVIDKEPDAGYISISQNDNRNFCQDAPSVALAQAEGSEAGPLLNFVNKVAARIHEKYPDFLVETLAYNGTETPPKTIRPGKNVLIRLAPIWSDFGHPLNSDWNPQARDNLLSWARITPNLFVWNYVTNFDNPMVAHPNWDGLDKDLRFFAANNVQGIFEEGDAETNAVGDFVQLRAWLMGKLMWNPTLDQDKLTAEFLQGYYKAAAPYLKQYLDLTEQSYLSQGKVLTTHNRDFSFLTLDVANKSIELFDQAEAAVKNNKDLLYRVQRERLSLRLALFYRYNSLKQTAAREGKTFLGPQDPQAALTDFYKTATEDGVGGGPGLKSRVAFLTQMLAPPVPLPEFAKNYPEDDVIDLQPASFTLFQPGKLTAIETDAQASAQTAASTISDSHDWDIQAPAGRYLDNFTSKWHIYAVVRIERPAVTPANLNLPASNLAFQIGIYDATSQKTLANDKGLKTITVPLDQLGPTYKNIDMGIYGLDSASTFIYFQPVANPAVEKIYVDRVLLIRQSKMVTHVTH